MKAEDISDRLEVSIRTVYRDVEALSMAGIPISALPGQNGGIWLDENYRVSLTGLSLEEIQTIFALSDHTVLNDIGIKPAMDNVLMKLMAGLPGIQRQQAHIARQRLFIDARSWFSFTEPLPFLSDVQKAIWSDREIEFLYDKPGHGPALRHIHPYGLVSKANTWYVVGCQEDQSFRTFRISRFLDLHILDFNFERDQAFDLERYWKESSGLFESQFSADYEAIFSISRDLLTDFEYNLPGRYVGLETDLTRDPVRICVSFFGEEEALMTVFRLSTQIDIISPPSLILKVREIAQKTFNYYQNSPLKP